MCGPWARRCCRRSQGSRGPPPARISANDELGVRERPRVTRVVEVDVRDDDVLDVRARNTSSLQRGGHVAAEGGDAHRVRECARAGVGGGVRANAEVEEDDGAGARAAEDEGEDGEIDRFAGFGDVDELGEAHVDLARVDRGYFPVGLIFGWGRETHREIGFVREVLCV